MTSFDDSGPFDFIGDVHGCIDELTALLAKLGYDAAGRHPAGRRVFFLGDLVNRGPDAVSVLRLVMRMVAEGTALCTPGNHDDVLRRQLAESYVDPEDVVDGLKQVQGQPPAFQREVGDFLTNLPRHRVLDGGRLVAAHAGLPEALQGLDTPEARRFAIYGQRPDREAWARGYRGAAKVVHGHLPTPATRWLNGTLDIDTGCVYGGRLTALRYPELELVAVPAARVYFESRRTPELVAAAQAYRY